MLNTRSLIIEFWNTRSQILIWQVLVFVHECHGVMYINRILFFRMARGAFMKLQCTWCRTSAQQTLVWWWDL